MHIAEGILAAPALAAGAATAAAGTAVGLKRMDYDQTPIVAVLSSTFFVASLIHVPLGPSNVHLILNGLVGIILGWASFPALLVALLLQAILFQFGGITTLGVNTTTMALPAVITFLLFSPMVRGKNQTIALFFSFLSGALGVLLAAILVGIFLISTGEVFETAARLIIIAHLPIMVIEGILATFIIGFLRKVKPEILGGMIQ